MVYKLRILKNLFICNYFIHAWKLQGFYWTVFQDPINCTVCAMEKAISPPPGISITLYLCVYFWCKIIWMSMCGNLGARCPWSKASCSWQQCIRRALSRNRLKLFLYSGHAIWQKNIFICFPGASHNGLYLFNKISPYKLQRLHRDWGDGVGLCWWFSAIYSSEWEGCRHYF